MDIAQNREASKEQFKLITHRMAGILEEVLGIAAKSCTDIYAYGTRSETGLPH